MTKWGNYGYLLRAWFVTKRIVLPPVDPIEEYVKPRKARLLKTYETDMDLSVNIDKVVYDKKLLAESMKDTANPLERIWKSRILYDSTPRGTIMMYYDIYKQGFSYYADQNNVPYAILNGMAMKYVVTFFCRDLYFDETVVERISPLVKVFLEDEKIVKPSGKNHAQMARLKSQKTLGDKPPPIRNKFISLGNMRDFKILQQVRAQLVHKPTKFDTMFSYKDFKSRGNLRFPLTPSLTVRRKEPTVSAL
jgi:hypothetical protein